MPVVEVVDVAPDVWAGVSFSSDVLLPGAVSSVFSPHLEKATLPWMSDELLAPGLVSSSIGSGDPLAGT